MTTENWIQLIVPIASIVAAIITAAFTYYVSKRKQILSDESRLKEKFYLNYIEALSNVVVSEEFEKSRDHFADAQNQLLLIGSAEVVKNLMNFHDYVKESNKEFDSGKHDVLLAELIKSMRSDLYRTTKVNDNYPPIHLTGKSSGK